MRVRTPSIRSMEVEALVSSSTICRRHGALQEALASDTYLSDIAHDCKAVGLDIDAIAQHEIASVLWDQGEIETSIRMRENLIDHATFDSQVTDISLPVLLAKLVSSESFYFVSLLTFTGTSSRRGSSSKPRYYHTRKSGASYP